MKLKPSIHQQSNRLLAGSIMALLVSIMPIVFFYAYMFFPATTEFKTTFFTFNSGYYNNVNTSAWVFVGKFVPLYLLILWYFTNKSWWKEALFGPIAMYLVQIVIYFNDEIKFKDEIDGLFIVPFVIATLATLYFSRRKLKNYIDNFNLLDQINEKLNVLKKE